MRIFISICLFLLFLVVYATEAPLDMLLKDLQHGQRNLQIPYGNYSAQTANRTLLHLQNIQDTVIDFSQSQINVSTPVPFAVLENCTNVTLKNLVLDYAPPFRQFKILQMNPDNSAEAALLDTSLPHVEPTQFATYEFAPVYRPNSSDNWSFRLILASIVPRNTVNQTYQLTFKTHNDLRTDDIVCLPLKMHQPHPASYQGAIVALSCANLRFENLTFRHTTHNYAIIEYDCNTNAYLNCHIRPVSDHLYATARHGFCSLGARRGPRVIGCSFSGVSDLCLQITGSFSVVHSVDGNAVIIASRDIPGATPCAGDTIDIIQMKPLQFVQAVVDTVDDCPNVQSPLAESQWPGLKFLRNVYTRYVRLTLKTDISLQPGDVLAAANRGGDHTVIADCIFGPRCTRGLILNGSDSIIRHCSFRDFVSEGICMMSPSLNWLEAGFPQRCVIHHNHFNNPRSTCPPIAIGYRLSSFALPSAPCYADFIVTQNSFTPSLSPDTFAFQYVRQATIAQTTLLDAPPATQPKLQSSHCEDIHILK